MRSDFQIGAVYPTTEIGSDPAATRDFVQAIEDLGYTQLVAYDHVIGADIRNRPEWNLNEHPYTHESAFYEPLILFSFAAGVTRVLRFLSAVVILPQRQTVMFGKQAATLDVLSGGRLSLGIGLGWNKVEYAAVGEGLDFKDRAPRMEDQIKFLRRLWTEPVFTDTQRFDMVEAGINPMPVQRPIPIIVGGGSEAGRKRAARLGDGWLPFLPASQAKQMVRTFRDEVRAANRDPEKVIFYNNILLGSTMGGANPVRSAEDAASDVELWSAAGATGVCFCSMDMGLTKLDQHISLFRRISELVGLKKRK
jgi:probable F420-dependent oxidoreductase